MGVDEESLAVDSSGRVTFFSRERGDQPLGPQLQRFDVVAQAGQVTSLDLAQWDFSDSSRAEQESSVKNRRMRSTWRPGQASQILLSTSSGMLLADTQTGEICRIEIRQQDKPLSGSLATWSPDGQHLAMLVRPTVSEGSEPQRHLAVIDMNTGQPFFPDLGTGDILDMEWGAESQHLAVLTLVAQSNAPNDVIHQLYLVDVSSQKVQQMLPNATVGGGSGGWREMSWSPDGRLLAIKCPIWPRGQLITEDHICLIATSKVP